jgi:UDP-3-O-[3-hydroxymyristoyl] glucosamine N-acyltransferase
MKLRELCARIEAELVGDGEVEVTSVAPLHRAAAGQVTYMANPKYIKQLECSKASAVIVAPNVRADGLNLLVVREPSLAFARTIRILHGDRKHPFDGVHPRATVEDSAEIGENVTVYPGCYVGPRAKIGRDTVLYPNVCVYEDCVIGQRCIVHAGVVIGSDGYGFVTSGDVNHKILQIGNVVIGDDVEIGPNTTISRAALDSTIIGSGTKIDQQVVIGHNVKVGEHCLFVAQAGLAGSVQVGHHVTLAGQVGVAGHLKIGDRIQVGGRSAVMYDLEEPGAYVGTPAMPYSHGRRVYAVFTDLPALVKRVRELESRVADLADEGDGV